MPSSTDQTLQNSTNIIRQITDAIFNTRSLLVLLVALVVGSLIGWLVNVVITNLSKSVGKRADKARDLATVKRLRRAETLLVLSTALVRIFFVAVSLYFWWLFTHPAGARPTALLGAGALLALILNGVFSPIFRDIAFGSSMMAEQWFGVGDVITVIPFNTLGVVERVTLRSTKIRSLDGDSIWITNQNVAGAKIVRRGVRTIALELFVSDDRRAEQLIERANMLLPEGPSLLISPLEIMTTDQKDKDCWHIVAIGETAPAREFLLEKNAVDILQKLDEKQAHPILLAEPIARYADSKVERQFGRAINNARKKKSDANLLLPLSDSLHYLRHRRSDHDGDGDADGKRGGSRHSHR